ncbi:hypothetical protein OU995_18335 [Roseateles sp. SL47]|uniref:hypothetical protein n=1 Tax=Roseateles sp. SL47 TaxID=2995138 RepID=UPI0022713818|nr:hypothetical protein [Roseateles sp. SL47]WAC71531.1 hypothetical protein OU995_18335 [Roseateles sp. SL47]
MKNRKHGRPARVLAHGCALGLALVLLGGCSDGYPAEDLDQTSPFDMTNAQRVRALNAVSAHANRRERTQFKLVDLMGSEGSSGAEGSTKVRKGVPCLLSIQHQRDGRSATVQQHTLRRGMDAVVSHNAAEGRFEVHLVDGVGPDARRLGMLMRSNSWTHATQVDLLVQLMIRDCGMKAEQDGGA